MSDDPVTMLIPFAIEPKQADRSRVISPKRIRLDKRGKPIAHIVHHYQPKHVEMHKARLIAAMKTRYPFSAPMDGPLEVTYRFCWSWPKTMKRSIIEAGFPVLRETKPDFDNCTKPLGDALEDAETITNDSRIARAIVEKCWWNSDAIWIEIRKVLPITTKELPRLREP